MSSMKCKHCGGEFKLEDIDPSVSRATCPLCGEYLMAEIEHQALCYAEKIGVYEYEVNEDGWFEYWSFFSGEGFIFVQHNLNTGEERRNGFIPWNKDDNIPVPMFLKEFVPNTMSWATKYNYNVG